MEYIYIKSLIGSTYIDFELVKLLLTNEMVEIAFIFQDIVDKLNEIGYDASKSEQLMLENTFSAMRAGDYSIEYCRELTTSYANQLKKYKVEPVCPLCLTRMVKVNYKGYYESFSCYKCLILIPTWFKEAISKGLKVNLILNNDDIEFYIETGCKSDMVISNRYGYFIATLRSGKEYECDTYEQFKMCLKECFMGRDFCHQYVTNILGEL